MAKLGPLPRHFSALPAPRALAHLVGLRLETIAGFRQGVRDGSVEAVHDMRVSCRRLQAILTVFKSCFRRKKRKAFRRTLRRLVRSLGDVREYDVLLSYITNSVKAATPEQRVALGLLVGRYSSLRLRSHRELVKLLSDILAGSDLFLRAPEIRGLIAPSGRNAALFGSLMRQAVPQLFKSFMSASVPVAGHPRRADALHRFRITGKPLRYIMELSASWFGPGFQTAYGEVKSVIELLGDIHDTDVALATLRQYLKEVRIVNASAGAPEGVLIRSGFLLSALAVLREKRASLFDALDKKLRQWKKERFEKKLLAICTG